MADKTIEESPEEDLPKSVDDRAQSTESPSDTPDVWTDPFPDESLEALEARLKTVEVPTFRS
jgi:hypothetical protein